MTFECGTIDQFELRANLNQKKIATKNGKNRYIRLISTHDVEGNS